MTQPQGTDILVEALRAAVQQSDPVRAGQLRLQLENGLGPQQSLLLRREIHQVIAAAEEHLPTRLIRLTPLTTPVLARLSAELAGARGWTPATAERATRIWAAALGFGDLATKEWPAVQVAPSRPPASIDPAVGVTARPPGAQDTPGAPEAQDAPGASPAPAEVRWPTPAKKLAAAHSRSGTGLPVLGVSQAYAGVPLMAFMSVILTLTVVLIVILLLLPGSGWLLVLIAVGAASYATRFLEYGALLATETGIEFVPYDGNLRRARPERSIEAPWHEVAVELGTVSKLSAAGRRFQIGPRNRSFATAAAAAAAAPARGGSW